ncbi:MAG TPA: SGNH/GDSL hydrolase family protein [Chitinophagaceae bacterium]|nr:SGNH/GDSL hydrolase family protein [Chitinophagaceae bacterium]
MAQRKQLTYLALGDSYTIGESVPAAENFPNQLVRMMREKGADVAAPDIVAKTGWTTAELKDGIAAAKLRESYDYVTLLIGVNNQYRNLAPEDYAREFEQLLKMAIQFAGGKSSNVIVVSIPDWGATPFARDRDRGKITEQINDFNLRNSRISAKHNVKYVDITEGTREALINPELVAGDKLHPSGVEYNRWSKAILKEMGL